MSSVNRPMWRFVLRPTILLALLGLAVYLLLPEIGSVHHSTHAIEAAQWWMAPIAVAISGLSFLGSAISLRGCTVLPLRFWRTVTAQLAAAFAGRLTPANAGSLGTLGSYLRKQGATVPEATACLGLDAVAGVLVHLTFLAAAAAAVGQLPHNGPHLPDHWLLGLIVVGALILSGAAAAWVVVHTKHDYGDRARHGLREGRDGLAAALRSPGRALELIAGSLLITVSQILTLYICLLAFRGHTGLITVAFVYLAGSALSAAAPTPGGLGAVEAALVGGLALFGTRGEAAVGAVVLYRLITFWLPIAPGAVAFTKLRHRDML